MNHHDQSNFGRKGFAWLTLLYHCASLKNSGQVLKQHRNPRQELIQKPWRDVVHWLFPHVLLNLLLIKLRPLSQRWPNTKWAGLFPHQWHIENVLRLDLRKTFSQLEFFPSDNTSLCQSDMQLSSTEKKNPHYCVIIITPNIILENIKMINAIQAFVFHESVNLFCLKYNMNLIKPSEKNYHFL